MLPTHQLSASYHGWDIYQRRPGFEFTPMMLGKIASFIVISADNRLAVFAFMYSLLNQLEAGPIEEDALLADAVATIQHDIDERRVDHHHERTFEYQNGRFVEVNQPPWWIPSFAD